MLSDASHNRNYDNLLEKIAVGMGWGRQICSVDGLPASQVHG
jgi:hypothetical protein